MMFVYNLASHMIRMIKEAASAPKLLLQKTI